MIMHAAKAGAIDLRAVLEEVLLSMRRAGQFCFQKLYFFLPKFFLVCVNIFLLVISRWRLHHNILHSSNSRLDASKS